MGAHRRTLQASVAAALLLATSVVSGDVVAAPSGAETAARALGRGNSLYKLEKYGAALAAFEEAFMARPDATLLFNIAQCHRKLGHGDEALRFLRRYLSEYEKENGKPPSNQGAVRNMIEEIEKRAAPPTAPALASPAGPVASSASAPAAPLVTAPVVPIPPAAALPPETAPAPPATADAASVWAPAPQSPTRWSAVTPAGPSGSAPAPAPAPAPATYVAPAPARRGPSASEFVLGAGDAYGSRGRLVWSARAGLSALSWTESAKAVGLDAGGVDATVVGLGPLAEGLFGWGRGHFLVAGDVGVRHIRSAAGVDDLSSVVSTEVALGARGGARTRFLDAWARLGWTRLGTSLDGGGRLSDDTVLAPSVGAAVEIHDLGGYGIAGTADFGIGELRRQNGGGGLRDGTHDGTTFRQFALLASHRPGINLEFFAGLFVRSIESDYVGTSARLSGVAARTQRDTRVFGLTLGCGLGRR